MLDMLSHFPEAQWLMGQDKISQTGKVILLLLTEILSQKRRRSI